ncbi:hypothetical protein MNBD_ALPHA11-572 [hydrothermal vent metagenome]|uniref:Uncharacterized protein n=1 Tax=hydrothermal vent metagenome TaxID=652676 RepID=A0A3B0U2W2_9ZZZZ
MALAQSNYSTGICPRNNYSDLQNLFSGANNCDDAVINFLPAIFGKPVVL